MAEQVAPQAAGQIDAAVEHVSAEEYMRRYAHDFYEWVRGELIKMAPISGRHDEVTGYLRELLRAYFALKPIGVVRQAPFVMRVDATESRREPDLQVILEANPGQLTATSMVGPADICIEVVSPESVTRDYGEKFAEYEKGGVGEYWIIDPVREEAHFYRLNEEGIYKSVLPGEQGHYRTPALPGLRVHVPVLWQEDLPDIIAVVRSVQAMLAE
jgi:Uma2 family endonuclease